MEWARSILGRIRHSLFLVPSIILVFAVLLARLATYADDRGIEEFPGLLSVSISGGRAIASAVAAATITVAALVFSITALTSQIAATQYSPRAVAGFLEDRFQKVVIGLVLGTFAFSLVVLGELSGVGDPDVATTPSLAVTAVMLLGVISVVAIVAYLDHSLNRMRIDAVVRRIAKETAAAVAEVAESTGHVDLEPRTLPSSGSHRVESKRTGWVSGIDARRLARELPPGTMASITVRVGEALFPGDTVAAVWAEGESLDDAQRTVGRCIGVARDRRIKGDPGYGIRQLVDIGLRALSPGINDPTTAIDVAQHLKLPMRRMLELGAPRRIEIGPEGQRVYLPEAPSNSDRVAAAFAQLRLAAAHHPAVLSVLIETMADLAESLEATDAMASVAPLRHQAALVIDAAMKTGLSESDLAGVFEAAERLGVPPSK